MTITAHGGKESGAIIQKYVRALNGDIPLGNPREIAEALHLITNAGNPEAVFTPDPVPDHLQILFREARIAKDRYFSELASWLMAQEPKSDETNLNRISIKGRNS
jgi:hypothetical protein